MISKLSGLSLVMWLGASAKANVFSLRILVVSPETNQSFYKESSSGGAVYPADSVARPWWGGAGMGGGCETIGCGGVCGKMEHEFHTRRSPDAVIVIKSKSVGWLPI